MDDYAEYEFWRLITEGGVWGQIQAQEHSGVLDRLVRRAANSEDEPRLELLPSGLVFVDLNLDNAGRQVSHGPKLTWRQAGIDEVINAATL